METVRRPPCRAGVHTPWRARLAQRRRPVETACAGARGDVPSAPKATCPALSQGQPLRGGALSLSRDPRPPEPGGSSFSPSHGRTEHPAADVAHGSGASLSPGAPRHPERPRRRAVGLRPFQNSPTGLGEAPRRRLGCVPRGRDSCSREHGRAPPRSPAGVGGAHGRTRSFPRCRPGLGPHSSQIWAARPRLTDVIKKLCPVTPHPPPSHAT